VLRVCVGRGCAAELREAVRQKTRLTCSVGVAPNCMLAKVCSDINKPDGQYVLRSDRSAVVSFVSTLPVRKISGIGRVAERVLASLGVTQCGHLLESCGTIGALFSPITSDFYLVRTHTKLATRPFIRLDRSGMAMLYPGGHTQW
jgi:DNA polymerase kappa